jgi:hypothetical protein
MAKIVKYYDAGFVGDLYRECARDSWEIPESGAKIWSTFWQNTLIIKPHPDGSRVIVGQNVYGSNEFIGIIAGSKWGIEGIKPIHEELVSGLWTIVPKDNTLYRPLKFTYFMP